MKKYIIGAEIRIFLQGKIAGKTEKSAAERFKMYLRNGNYDRQIMRNLLDHSQDTMEINVDFVQPVWRKNEN